MYFHSMTLIIGQTELQINDFRKRKKKNQEAGSPWTANCCIPCIPNLELDLPGILVQSHWSHLSDLVEVFQTQIFPLKPFRLRNLPCTMKYCFISSVPIFYNKQHDQIWGEMEALWGKKRPTLYFQNSYMNKCLWSTFRRTYFFDGRKILPATKARSLD